MRFRTFLLTLLVVPILFAPLFSNAQLTPQDALTQITQNVSIVTSPKNPEPNNMVSISIESYSTDLDQSKIVWAVDGKIVKSGTGIKNISVQAGGLGTSKSIEISISPTGATPFKKSLIIKPSEVDLVWQGNTYTPPFYKGRTLWSGQSDFTALAIPHIVNSSGREANPANFFYKWSRNGEAEGNSSGVGKNSIKLSTSIFPIPQEIQVEISDGDSILATKKTVISSNDMSLLVFEDNPLYGPLFNNGVIDKISLKEKEVTLIAYPLFFNTQARENSFISYSWLINGLASGQNTSSVTFRAPDNSGGSSDVSVHIGNTVNFTQMNDKSFNIGFNNQSNI